MSKIGIFYIYDTAPLTFRQIYHHPMIVDDCTIAHSNSLIKTNRMTVNLSFCNHWMARYLTKRQKSAFFTFTILRHLTFHQISRHPMVVEGCTIAHSNRLIKTNRMVVSLSIYDHWMARYLTKCQKSAFFIYYDTVPLTFYQISHHPMIVEGCTIAYSNRLIKANRMTVNSPFYDHWMARYLTKRQKLAFF